jgi:hypothetical protein
VKLLNGSVGNENLLYSKYENKNYREWLARVAKNY